MAFLRLVFAIVLICLVQIWQSDAEAVKVFKKWDDFKKDLFDMEISMVDYYASWCPHCVTFAPLFEKAAGDITHEGNLKEKVQLVKIQCDSEVGKPICDSNGIQGFPTIYVYKNGEKLDEYKGARSPEAIVKYVKEVVKTGKPQFEGKQANEQQTCLAKDYMKYVHKSRKN